MPPVLLPPAICCTISADFAAIFFCGSTPAQEPSEKAERKEYAIEGTPRKIWVYFPKGKLPEKLPCILIDAAGSRLFHGINLTEGDSAEHYPYAAAGFAVVAYDISGPLEDEELEDEGKILGATGMSGGKIKQV